MILNYKKKIIIKIAKKGYLFLKKNMTKNLQELVIEINENLKY